MDKLKRAIVIFPRFENSYHIDHFRSQCDPLSITIEPHITLVFPFESHLSIESLRSHVEQIIQGFKPFPIRLYNITGSEGEYLFLNVKQGNDQIIELHDRLYSGLLAEYLSVENIYVPHLTIGRINNRSAFISALGVAQHMKFIFQTTVEEVAIIRIDDNNLVEARIRL
jgi:2'-5' RNA ligase